MATMLDKIHEETGITILSEGTPDKVNADLSFQGPLSTALDQIADTFDYTWAPSKKLSKTLLFNKRFRSPQEHPEWFEKEMLHVAEQVCRALESPLSISEPYGNTRDLLHLLYHKLSPEQLQFLYQGGQLSFQDLDARQSLLLSQQIYSVALGRTTDAWQHLRSRLAKLKSAKLVIRPSDSYRALTLVYPPAVDGTPDSVIVRYYTDADLAPGASEASILPMNLERTALLSVQASAREHEEQSALRQRVDVRMEDAQLVDLLREVSLCTHCKIAAPDYLKEQRFSLWTKGCSVRLLMELLAEQNEWEWTYTARTGITIARRDTFVPANLSEVSAAFRIAMPPGYRHFLGWGVAADDWLKGDEDKTNLAYRRIPGGDVMAIRRTVSRKASAVGYDDPVMLRIWPTQPQKFSRRDELVYKDWTLQTKNAVLWSLFANAMRGFFGDGWGIDVIEGRLAPYELNPELTRLHLDGKKEGEYSMFGYSSSTADSTGRMNTMGFFWTLKNAVQPLPPPLEEISKRYY